MNKISPVKLEILKNAISATEKNHEKDADELMELYGLSSKEVFGKFLIRRLDMTYRFGELNANYKSLLKEHGGGQSEDERSKETE